MDLVISLGPQPVIVPNVVGHTLAAAGGILSGRGFSTGAVTFVASDSVALGEVMIQNPAARTLASPGAVAVTVSTGKDVPLTSIVVQPANEIIRTADALVYYATGVYSDGTSADVTSAVVWSSTAGSVASINPGGTATGLSAGPTTIKATSGAVTGSTMLTVKTRTLGDQTAACCGHHCTDGPE